jgi:hypothetical protein
MLAAMLEHHPDGTLTHLCRKLRGCSVIRHGSSLSRVGASGKSGAVQSLARNAGSDVITDIIFLRRRAENQPAIDESGLSLSDLGTPDGPMCINSWAMRESW